MEGKRLIEKIRLRNILSFGDKGEDEGIELLPLNIIIGQNASGKSNLVDAIKLLRSLPQDRGLASFISRNGGINEWIWKGKKSEESAMIAAQVRWLDGRIKYQISFTNALPKIKVLSEEFFNANGVELFDSNLVRIFHENVGEDETLLSYSGLEFNASKAELIFFRNVLLRFVAIYTDLQTNRGAEIRRQQPADAPNDFLDENGSNLSLILSDLQLKGNAKDKVIDYLQKFYPKFKDYLVIPSGGTVQLYLREEGFEKPISAMRLSDGTLRYLCLLAILCHPEPPPLICIEEPETGLHPDILPTIAELMKDAAQRTQLIVTTHSDILVSAFSDMPEAVMVCEKDEDGTHFKRLQADKLKVWLEEYTLGEAWLRGAIGGTRW